MFSLEVLVFLLLVMAIILYKYIFSYRVSYDSQSAKNAGQNEGSHVYISEKNVGVYRTIAYR